MLRTVKVRFKFYPLLADLGKFFLSRVFTLSLGRSPMGETLGGFLVFYDLTYPAMLNGRAQTKNLKAATVRPDRPIPIHELMQTAHFFNKLITGTQI